MPAAHAPVTPTAALAREQDRLRDLAAAAAVPAGGLYPLVLDTPAGPLWLDVPPGPELALVGRFAAPARAAAAVGPAARARLDPATGRWAYRFPPGTAAAFVWALARHDLAPLLPPADSLASMSRPPSGLTPRHDRTRR